MSYLEHMQFALGLAWSLGWATAASVVHAFFPDILETYTSQTIRELNQRLNDSGCRED